MLKRTVNGLMARYCTSRPALADDLFRLLFQDLGHKVPTLNRLLVCKIYTIELLEKRADTEWSESLVPVLKKDFTLPDWCADNPLWASIVLAMDTVGYYRMHWVEAVLANGLWN